MARRPGNTSVGRFVQIQDDGTACWAFLPNALPHPVNYSPRLAMLSSEANLALGELRGLTSQLQNPDLLIGPFVRREAVLSSRIEGTQTRIEDLYAYEAGSRRIRGDTPQHLEVFNYVESLNYGLERLATLPMSQRLIRDVHLRLMRNVRGRSRAPGQFRQNQNWLGPEGQGIEQADFIPPPVPKMNEALSEFEEYLHEDKSKHPPLVRIAMIHYQFEAIHPFIDGNGRVGRLLIALLLVHWGLLPLPFLYLSAFFEQNRTEYYDRLLAVSKRGAVTPWVEFFLRGVAEQARDAIARVKQLQELQGRWRDYLTDRAVSSRVLRLMDSLFESPLVTIPRAAKRLDVTYHSGRDIVGKLIEANILRQIPQQRHPKLFVADAVIDIARDDL